ncbi:MAG TPA: DUF5990 family protein [Terracidiphilus sp.]
MNGTRTHLSHRPGKTAGRVDFALQKGKGNNYEIVQKQRSGKGDLRFDFTARATAGTKSAAPNLLGPFVQGPVGERFVYIGIGAFVGQIGGWSRRLKIPLSGITTDLVARTANDPKLILESRVPGTGRDGGPNCATVKPFAGWKLV